MSLADTPNSTLSPSFRPAQPPMPPSIEEFHASLLQKLAMPRDESRSEYLQWSRGDAKKHAGGVRGISTPEIVDESLRTNSSSSENELSASWFASDDPEALLAAAMKGDDAAVKAFLCNSNLENANKVGSNGHTALTAAASNGHVEVVTLLLADARIDPCKRSNNRFSPIMWAATNGHAAVLRKILEDGRANPNEKSCLGCTPLFLASSGGHADAVFELLCDVRIDANCRCKKGVSALEVATEKMHLGVINHLLADGRADQSSLKLRPSKCLDEALGLTVTSPVGNSMDYIFAAQKGSVLNMAALTPQEHAPIYHVA